MAFSTASSIFDHNEILTGAMDTWINAQGITDLAAMSMVPISSAKVLVTMVYGVT